MTQHPRRILALGALLLALVAGCSEAGIPDLALEPALGGATFTQPIEVAPYPDGRTLVAERGGRIWLADGAGEVSALADLSPLVDADRGEGLLSVALDPAFDVNGMLWVYYFASDEPSRTVLARFELQSDTVDLATELVVLEFPQPGFNQNGGAIRFGSAGYLYLSLGDGSASTDPFDQGQDRTTLLATVIRIDVEHATVEEPYRIPPSNPFVDTPGTAPEIFAFGLRNPFRMTIDLAGDAADSTASDDIWLGDVGVSNAEEVNRITAGGNYGWSIVEGDACIRAVECDRDGLIPPVHSYAHDLGRCAVIGGVVYRGDAIEALQGRYLFGDLCSGEIWALDPDAPDSTAPLIADLDGMLVTFALDADGEVLVADHDGGGVYRLVEVVR